MFLWDTVYFLLLDVRRRRFRAR